MGGGRQEDDEGVDEGEMSLVGRVRPEADTHNFNQPIPCLGGKRQIALVLLYRFGVVFLGCRLAMLSLVKLVVNPVHDHIMRLMPRWTPSWACAPQKGGEHGMCRGFLVSPWSLSVGAPFAPNSSGFLPNYFGLYSEPIFEVVTAFTAPFLVKLIRTYPN